MSEHDTKDANKANEAADAVLATEAVPAKEAKPKPEIPVIDVTGIFEMKDKNSGQLIDATRFGKTTPHDVFVPRELVQRFKLKPGSTIVGRAEANPKFQNPKLVFVETVDGDSIDKRKARYRFNQLTSIAPEVQLKLETAEHRMSGRVADLFCPLGKGTRGLIVAPPRTGKTTLLHDFAHGILENHPEVHLMVLLVDERPEEVTDFQRSVQGAELFASSNDEPPKNHLRIAELAIERARRLCEVGKDVVVLLDSITRLARAYNVAKSSGRTMSGGLDVRAMEKPRQLFSAARNTEEAGTITIIGTALVQTGSRMDDLIFQEFKGTGNMEFVLDRKIAELRLWPAINLASSGTRREELILPEDTLEKANFLRRAFSSYKTIEATETLLERMSTTKTNAELLRLLNK